MAALSTRIGFGVVKLQATRAECDLWRSEVRGEDSERGRWSEVFLQAFEELAEVFIFCLVKDAVKMFHQKFHPCVLFY